MQNDTIRSKPAANYLLPPSIALALGAAPRLDSGAFAARQVLSTIPARFTDAPSPEYYYSGEMTRLTGFSLEQITQLELLGAHPGSSGCHHVWGRAWAKHQVDQFVAYLDEPGARAWVIGLLDEGAVHAPAWLVL